MALNDRGALALLVVSALALSMRFAPTPWFGPERGWTVFWDEGGSARWTADSAMAEGARFDRAGATIGRFGGRLGLLTGTRLDPDAATREDWIALPGVGAKTADSILAARERLGGFKASRDLLEVKGIGPKRLEKLSPWLRNSSGADSVSGY